MALIARAIVLFMAGLASFTVTAQTNDLKLGYYPGAMQSIQMWVADAKGFYKAHGLNVEMIPVSNGALMSSNIASGAIDIGYNSPFNLGVGRKQGLNQVIVEGNMSMMVVLIARTGLELPHSGKYPDVLRDFRGMNWGTYGRGADTEELARIMIREAGMDPDKDVTWIGVGPPNTGLPALKAKRVDIYVSTPPAPEFATALGFGQVVVDTRKGEGLSSFKGVVYNTVMARDSTVQNRPDALRKFIAASRDTFCWVKDQQHFEELVGIVKAKMPLADLSDKQYREAVANAVAILTTAFPPNNLDPWNDLMVKAGVIASPMPRSVVWTEAPSADPACR